MILETNNFYYILILIMNDIKCLEKNLWWNLYAHDAAAIKVILAFNFLKDLSSLSFFTRGNKAFQMKLVKYKVTT